MEKYSVDKSDPVESEAREMVKEGSIDINQARKKAAESKSPSKEKGDKNA